jgi:hypothetical protein
MTVIDDHSVSDPCYVGPCHQPLVVDEGDRPPDMEGSHEYVEYAVADSQQGVVLQLGGRVRG